MHDDDRLAQAKRELKELQATFAFAFAFGHGCSVGDHPDHRAVRARVADLRAQIQEHTP